MPSGLILTRGEKYTLSKEDGKTVYENWIFLSVNGDLFLFEKNGRYVFAKIKLFRTDSDNDYCVALVPTTVIED